MLGRKLSGIRARAWRAAVLRSGMLTALILALLLGGLIVLVRERGKGHLHQLEMELQAKKQVPVATIPPPGGQNAIVMTRTPVSSGSLPEFVSATLLPGRGMNVLQIMANLPSLGEVPLLVSPSLEGATTRLSGAGADIRGLGSLQLGGAFEVPWANKLGGVPTPDEENIMSVWQGQTLVLPATPKDKTVTGGLGPVGTGVALGGLMLKRQADKVETHVVPDGWQSRSVYNAGSFDGHWLSQTEVTTLILLNGRVMEFGVVAKNTGSAPEPIGIGWRPRFAIPSSDRENALLRLPNADRVEVRQEGTGAGLPSGKLLPVTGTEFDYTKQAGTRLGTTAIDGTYVHLKQGLLDVGPVVELRDPKGRFGLRITLLSPQIKAIRVQAPADQAMVVIDPQFNYDDPFGKEWAKDEDTGMVVLQPGQVVQWKIRLELFPLAMQTGAKF